MQLKFPTLSPPVYSNLSAFLILPNVTTPSCPPLIRNPRLFRTQEYLKEGLGSSIVIFQIPCYNIDLTAACISFQRAKSDHFEGFLLDFCD